ncbi:MAG: hypothetical protein RMJ17_03730 [Candidatus Aenigmarchaeota archaeon]|nr:hypothetical protein [Candidatus Aenigmarchaeota archaeon]MDW8149673.1 hypothetical protein [Candidatus Aenigmarchaeota archaeon]
MAEIVIHIEKNKFFSLLNKLKEDEKVSLATIKTREASIIGKDGFLIIVSGIEEYCNRAKEIATTNGGVLLDEAYIKKVLEEIKKEEEKAKEGFGFLLG